MIAFPVWHEYSCRDLNHQALADLHHRVQQRVVKLKRFG